MSVRPSGSSSVYPSVRHSFPHFSPTCFWNFVYHFILMHVRSSLNAINFLQFLLELYPFWTTHSYKYAVFRIFLLHALTYWAEILHLTLFHSILQIKLEFRQFASIFVGVMPLLELRILEIHSFPYFSLTCFNILNWNFACDFVLLYCRSSSSVVNLRQFLQELCPLLWHIELICFIWLCLMYCRLSSSVITLCPYGSPSVHLFSALSSYMHWQI